MYTAKNKVALITGGTSGIGYAFAERLVAEGMSVVVCGRDPVKLERTAARLPGVLARSCDVTNPFAVSDLLAQLDTQFGRLDLLVSNAGGLVNRDFAKGENVVSIEEEIRVNLTAPMALAAQATPLLMRTPGSAFVFVSSGYALAPVTRAPGYSAAKAGLHAFAKALRRQLKLHGVSVLEVLPPLVDTPAVAYRDGKKIPPQDVVAATMAALAKGRPEAYVGQTTFLPTLLRLVPTFAEEMVAKT